MDSNFVLEALARGEKTTDIAAKLGVSRKKINNIVTGLRSKGYNIPSIRPLKSCRRKTSTSRTESNTAFSVLKNLFG